MLLVKHSLNSLRLNISYRNKILPNGFFQGLLIIRASGNITKYKK